MSYRVMATSMSVRMMNLLKVDRGFTLVELLVAMAMGLVVLGAVLNIFIHQNQTNAVQQEVVYAQQNVRSAMDLMARDIRSAGYDPAYPPSGLVAVPAATSTSIQIRADLNGDGDTSDTSEDVTYALLVDDTDASRRCLGRGGTRIVYYVVPNSLWFTYYKADASTFVPASQADRDDIRAVGIQFHVHTENEDANYTGGYDINASGSGTCRLRALATTVRIRNLGFQDLE